MFPEMLQAADQIDAALEVNEDEAELLRETAIQYEEMPGGYAVATALRGIAREAGLHAQAMRDQLQALRAACAQAGDGSGTARH